MPPGLDAREFEGETGLPYIGGVESGATLAEPVLLNYKARRFYFFAGVCPFARGCEHKTHAEAAIVESVVHVRAVLVAFRHVSALFAGDNAVSASVAREIYSMLVGEFFEVHDGQFPDANSLSASREINRHPPRRKLFIFPVAMWRTSVRYPIPTIGAASLGRYASRSSAVW